MPRVVNTTKTQNKKQSNKAARNSAKKGGKAQPKAHHYGIAHNMPTGKESRAGRGRNARNQLYQRGHKTQGPQATKTATLYYGLRKTKIRKKRRAKTEIVVHCISKALSRGFMGANASKKAQHRPKQEHRNAAK